MIFLQINTHRTVPEAGSSRSLWSTITANYPDIGKVFCGNIVFENFISTLNRYYWIAVRIREQFVVHKLTELFQEP